VPIELFSNGPNGEPSSGLLKTENLVSFKRGKVLVTQSGSLDLAVEVI
jgi:hypothetical protein